MLVFLIALAGWVIDNCPVVIEPPQFWTATANDNHQADAVRRDSVIRLINRHATPGMTLTAFGHLFGVAGWVAPPYVPTAAK